MLTFLDSHIEATEGWLEPLLERVALDPKAVACPVIEEISDKTLQYKFVTRNLEGSFHWNLEFDWREVDKVDWAPYPSSVMAGGLFTIRKDWFEQLGFYDPGMEIWGGEQLELSFKAWMCGGKVGASPWQELKELLLIRWRRCPAAGLATYSDRSLLTSGRLISGFPSITTRELLPFGWMTGLISTGTGCGICIVPKNYS